MESAVFARAEALLVAVDHDLAAAIEALGVVASDNLLEALDAVRRAREAVAR